MLQPDKIIISANECCFFNSLSGWSGDFLLCKEKLSGNTVLPGQVCSPSTHTLKTQTTKQCTLQQHTLLDTVRDHHLNDLFGK